MSCYHHIDRVKNKRTGKWECPECVRIEKIRRKEHEIQVKGKDEEKRKHSGNESFPYNLEL